MPCSGIAEATPCVSCSPGLPVGPTDVDVEALERRRFTPAEPGRPARPLVSCGPPVDVDARIVDPDTHAVLPAGAVGEIWLRGPGIARGYWRDAEASRAFE